MATKPHAGTCSVCNKPSDDVAPYGPGGADICVPCAMTEEHFTASMHRLWNDSVGRDPRPVELEIIKKMHELGAM